MTAGQAAGPAGTAGPAETAGPAGTAGTLAGRRFPPVSELATVSLALVVVGGILMASYAPRRPPLGWPAALASGAAVLLLVSVLLLARLPDFNRGRFTTVFRWALLAYVISAAMIGFAFIRDHTRGAPLVLVLIMLVMFAVDVPLIIGFTVARYSSPPHAAN